MKKDNAIVIGLILIIIIATGIFTFGNISDINLFNNNSDNEPSDMGHSNDNDIFEHTQHENTPEQQEYSSNSQHEIDEQSSENIEPQQKSNVIANGNNT